MRNTLLQDSETLLMGSTDAINALAQKDSANLLVVSDTHGAASTLSLIISEFGKESDALIFCGDGIPDLAAVIEHAINEPSYSDFIPPVIAFVAGNNDYDRYPTQNPLWKEGGTEDFYQDVKIPLVQTLTVCSQKIYITHGHRHSLYSGTDELEYTAMNEEASVALYGHTHIAEVQNKTGMFMLNPGSCSRPRSGQPKSFARIELKNDRSCDSIFYEFRQGGSKPFNPNNFPHWW